MGGQRGDWHLRMGWGSIVILAQGSLSVSGSITANGVTGAEESGGFTDGGGAGGSSFLPPRPRSITAERYPRLGYAIRTMPSLSQGHRLI
jgi:hypothetical protein